MSLLDRSTGKVSLGRLGRRRKLKLSLAFCGHGTTAGMFDSRIASCKARPRARRCCYACVLGWGRMGHGGVSKKAAHRDQHGGRGSIAGSTRACWRWRSLPSRHRCWISMGRCLAGRGWLIPAAGLLEARRPAAKGSQESRDGGCVGLLGVLVGGKL